MEPQEKIYREKKQIFVNNFIGGVAWGLGATVGLSIFVAILSLILNKINLIPVIGDFVSQISDYVSKTNSNLIK